MRAENEFFRQCVATTVLKIGETNAESRGSQRVCGLFQNPRLAQTCAMPYPARNLTPKDPQQTQERECGRSYRPCIYNGCILRDPNDGVPKCFNTPDVHL
jgi:hypothetical protein